MRNCQVSRTPLLDIERKLSGAFACILSAGIFQGEPSALWQFQFDITNRKVQTFPYYNKHVSHKVLHIWATDVDPRVKALAMQAWGPALNPW